MRLAPLFAAAALTLGTAARADEGAYAGFLGGGALLQIDRGEPTGVKGSVLFKSVYGLTDAVNWEGPALLSFARGRAELALGTGLEYVPLQTNHWRFNLGLGGALMAPLAPSGPLDGAPYAEAALRWLAGWGLGFSLEVHGLYPLGIGRAERRGLLLDPALAIYGEI